MNSGDETLGRCIAEAVGPLPAGGLSIAGEGLWGPTIDLRDGSLLKLVRRRAGIGDGLDIQANEVRVLAALGGGPIEGVAVPRLIGHGSFAPATAAATAGFAAWLRLTRVPGRPFGEADLSALAASERDRFARSLGHSIARLQRDAARSAGDRLAGLDERTDSLLRTLAATGADEQERDVARRLRATLRAMPERRRRRFVHGDAHLQNLMVDGATRVCSFFDFAEAGRGFPEIDLAYLHWLPEIAEPVRQSFQDIAGPVDEFAYQLAGAIYALTGCVIARQRGEPADADRALLDRCLRLAFPGN